MILTGAQIGEWMNKPFPDRLVITPILERNLQLSEQQVSVDVRLGQDFLLTRTAGVEAVNPTASRVEFDAQVARSQQRVHVSVGQAFVLHPGRFTLGATLEYIRVPPGLAAYVIGRSSWARLGLVIAMATAVHPRFAGVLTLELQNLGDVPLALYPGSRIAQLIFHTTQGPSRDPDQPDLPAHEAAVLTSIPPPAYACQTGPSATALRKDPEWDKIRKIGERRDRSVRR
jgi:dCTP deaminase